MLKCSHLGEGDCSKGICGSQWICRCLWRQWRDVRDGQSEFEGRVKVGGEVDEIHESSMGAGGSHQAIVNAAKKDLRFGDRLGLVQIMFKKPTKRYAWRRVATLNVTYPYFLGILPDLLCCTSTMCLFL